ncbi:levanase/fructan beta-fructosidase [Kribbella orskensis]|uniref:Levanase/fructan beta-fructosidase n=1 Tax=Kribbella orskensis TaxID=2512216 RepID=A0ABY2BLB7_9ACTN|nr:levanase/fructan beta-fructosidase [Kribbella sp. VKM Ac-2500]TCO23111.1 levanase/fructan beta-fructosidase [Kribbella orskensis]
MTQPDWAVVTASPVAGEYFPYVDTDYQEANRGQFHFSSRSGWMNDPNGLLYYRGTYHLYYQHNPYGLAWDTMHWGHATSPDLIHWRQQPIALDPRIHPGDLWSGGGVVDTRDTSGLKDGSHDPIVVFSGTQGVRMLYSLDGGSTFTAYDDGRVVAQPSGTESRDPKVCWHEQSGRWVMVVWSDAGGNGVDFFVSADLRDWERVSRFAAGWLFECPDFTPMALDGDVTYVLRDARGSYLVGDFDGREFRTSWSEPCTITRNTGGAGSDYYAAQSFENLPDDRVVTLAWQGGNRGSIWTGNASFPVQQRLVSTPDGPRLFSEPIDEIRLLRSSTTKWGPVELSPDTARDLLSAEAADTYELEATFDLSASQATAFSFRLGTATDARSVRYDLGSAQLDGYDLPVAPDGTLSLRLLVDRGQLDIFATDGAFYECLNVDFEGAGHGLQLVTDGPLMLKSLTLHQLGSIWDDGLPA